jgi:hypothetical protein
LTSDDRKPPMKNTPIDSENRRRAGSVGTAASGKRRSRRWQWRERRYDSGVDNDVGIGHTSRRR